MNKLRVVFMGTPDFALPSLELLDSKYSVVGVFCQPDKINGRGNKMVFGPVKEYALAHNIPVFQPSTFKDGVCADILNKLDPELIVVAAYGKILPSYVLDYPKYGCINVHGSLLPKYRGASPIQAAVLNGDKVTGITIMYMSLGLDKGDIIHTCETEIGEYETAGELFDRLSTLGANCLDEAVLKILEGNATRTPQDDTKATHVSMITKDMGDIDFSLPAYTVKCLVYGLNPWPCAYVKTESMFLKIHKVVMGGGTNCLPGEIVSVSKQGIEVACGDNTTVIITEIQKQGKKKMDAYSFSLGHTINIGCNIKSL